MRKIIKKWKIVAGIIGVTGIMGLAAVSTVACTQQKNKNSNPPKFNALGAQDLYSAIQTIWNGTSTQLNSPLSWFGGTVNENNLQAWFQQVMQIINPDKQTTISFGNYTFQVADFAITSTNTIISRVTNSHSGTSTADLPPNKFLITYSPSKPSGSPSLPNQTTPGQKSAPTLPNNPLESDNSSGFFTINGNPKTNALKNIIIQAVSKQITTEIKTYLTGNHNNISNFQPKSTTITINSNLPVVQSVKTSNWQINATSTLKLTYQIIQFQMVGQTFSCEMNVQKINQTNLTSALPIKIQDKFTQ